MSEDSIKGNKFSRNLEKKNKIEMTSNSFREPTIVKFMHTTRFQEVTKPIPIVGPGPREF